MQRALRRCLVFWEGRKVHQGDILIDFYLYACPCELFIFLYAALTSYYESLLKVTVKLLIPRHNESWKEISVNE